MPGQDQDGPWAHEHGAKVYVGTVNGNTLVYDPSTRMRSSIGRY